MTVIFKASEARAAVELFKTTGSSDESLGIKYFELFQRIRTESAKGVTKIGIYVEETTYAELVPFLTKNGYSVYQIPISQVATSGATFPVINAKNRFSNGIPTIIDWTVSTTGKFRVL
jgi:hypothetical protein